MPTNISTTPYFDEQVLRKRPYLKMAWCVDAIREPERTMIQGDGRIRYWTFVPELGKHLRVVTLADGCTILNAFPDRNFKQ